MSNARILKMMWGKYKT